MQVLQTETVEEKVFLFKYKLLPWGSTRFICLTKIVTKAQVTGEEKINRVVLEEKGAKKVWRLFRGFITVLYYGKTPTDKALAMGVISEDEAKWIKRIEERRERRKKPEID